MRTLPLSSLLSSMQSGTALLGLCFTPQRIDLAVTSLKVLQPRQLPQAPSLDADGLLRLVKEQQIGAVLLGGSALFRTNGLTQFGARHLVSRVGGDPFSNIGEAEESMQLPIALWTRPGDDAVKMITDFLQP
ncbi:TPA: hypothetical protein ACH3X1_007240 [Trebouxia sp. C0004]